MNWTTKTKVAHRAFLGGMECFVWCNETEYAHELKTPWSWRVSRGLKIVDAGACESEALAMTAAEQSARAAWDAL